MPGASLPSAFPAMPIEATKFISDDLRVFLMSEVPL